MLRFETLTISIEADMKRKYLIKLREKSYTVSEHLRLLIRKYLEGKINE